MITRSLPDALGDLLSPQDVRTITHALGVAAERFDEDEKVCREASQPALAAQFAVYARDARAMRDRIEGDDEDDDE